MLSNLRPALTLLALFTFITGIAYPLAVTAAAQLAFPEQANGSLIDRDGRVLGSSLIAQPFTGERYFWGRPSATTPGPNNASASSGSNLGPTNPALSSAVNDRVAALRTSSPEQGATAIPVDLVTSSASGLDPQISPAAALYQVPRVAKARGLSEDRVRELVLQHIESRTFGVLGEPRVNVLLLNLALDGL